GKKKTYLIHGTNEPRGIGMRVTSGCIRMFPEDVESLFGRVPVGTTVQIVNQPVKAGWVDSELYVEAHPVLPPEAENAFDPVKPPTLNEAVLTIAGLIDQRDVRIDHERLKSAVDAAIGMPEKVSRPTDIKKALLEQGF
ncbi:MAG: L,D-transpeptidase family protein, partial [Gammaproteobacteria bacterium]|nr:L,D-transpeptidase family protein [Gammaproteobacteria bacterium]